MLRQIGVALLIAVVWLAMAAPSPAIAREIHKDPQGRTVWTKQTLEMKIKSSGNASEIKTVELWYRLDGGEWKCWTGESQPTDTPAIFRVKFTAPRTGVYDFFSVSIDQAGKNNGQPKADSTPMMTIHFDYEFPQISLAFDSKSETVKPGEAIYFDWSASDAAMKNAHIFYYFDDNELDAKSVELDGERGTNKITVPKDGVDSVTIYMAAEDFGGLKTISKKRTFKIEHATTVPEKIEAPRPVPPTKKIDSTKIQPVPEKRDTDCGNSIVPQAIDPSQSPENNPLNITIRYDVTTVGLSGLDRVELWVARMEGEEWQTKNWSLHETARGMKGEFVFVPQEVGQYAFYIIAGNKAGLWSRPRPDGATCIAPDYSTWIDDQKPSLRVLSPAKDDVFRGGARICVRWLAQDNNLADTPIKIELLRDGKFVAFITEATGNSGEFAFDAPTEQGTYSIRITAADQAGHTTVETSEAFVVDTCSPKVTIQILDKEGLPLVDTPTDADAEKSCAPEAADTNTEKKDTDAPEAAPQEPAEKSTDAAEYLMRGRSFLQNDQIDLAITELARAAELAPDNDKVLNEYGIALYRGGQYAQALANFTRATQIAPGESRYRWNIFLCNYGMKNADGAAASALAVLAMDGNLAEACEMIDAVMLLYQNAGRTNEIAGFLKNVLAIKGIGEAARRHVKSKTPQ